MVAGSPEQPMHTFEVAASSAACRVVARTTGLTEVGPGLPLGGLMCPTFVAFKAFFAASASGPEWTAAGCAMTGPESAIIKYKHMLEARMIVMPPSTTAQSPELLPVQYRIVQEGRVNDAQLSTARMPRLVAPDAVQGNAGERGT